MKYFLVALLAVAIGILIAQANGFSTYGKLGLARGGVKAGGSGGLGTTFVENLEANAKGIVEGYVGDGASEKKETSANDRLVDNPTGRNGGNIGADVSPSVGGTVGGCTGGCVSGSVGGRSSGAAEGGAAR